MSARASSSVRVPNRSGAMYGKVPIVLPVLVNRVSLGGAGDPEIDQVGEVVLVEQNVGGFDIAVQQADLVRGMQREGDLFDDAHRPRRLQRPVGQHGLQVAALDQPHIDVQAAVDFAVVVNRDDMGVFNRAAAWASRRNRC